MFLPVASSSAEKVDTTLYYIVGIEVVLLALVTVAMIYFVIRYNKRKNPRPKNIEGGPVLEILWTVIPTILVLIMFFIGLKGFIDIRQAPEEALRVKVMARQWSWQFEYDNGKRSDVLRIPLGKPVKLLLTSQDVIHSFYVPDFRIKEDCVPGMETYLWFTAKTTGTFDIFCTEYCGLGHSRMLSKVIVTPPEEFDRWYVAKGPEAREKGLKLLEEKGCIGCHSTDGTKKIGPTLKGIFGRKVDVLTGGKGRAIIVDAEYLRRSILDPQADIVKGFPPVMPKIPMTGEEVEAVTAFLKGLK